MTGEPTLGLGADPAIERHFPGWRVVWAAFALMMVSSGLAFYGLSAYLAAFVDQRGFKVAAFSLATTIFFATGGICGVFAARLVARRDPRHVVAAGSVVAGLALAAAGQATEVWQVYATFIPLAIGWALCGLVPVTTVVTRWFHIGRASALALASTGLSVGGVVVTPVVKLLLDRYDLKTVTPWLGAFWIVTSVPIALIFLYPDPSSRGWSPDGAELDTSAPVPAPTGTPFAVALRTRFFSRTTVAYVLVMGSQVGGLQHLVRLVQERTTRQTAAAATLVVAIASIAARLAGGQIASRVRLTPYTASLAGLQAVGLAAIAVSMGKASLFVSILIYGVTVGNLLMLQPLLVAQRFGVRDYPKLYSRMNLITTVGIAGGPFLLGWIRDATGGYRGAYLTAAMLSLVGAAVLATAGPTEATDE